MHDTSRPDTRLARHRSGGDSGNLTRRLKRCPRLQAWLLVAVLLHGSAVAGESATNGAPALHIGWAAADITPDQPVLIQGQMHGRVSEGVADPITATVLALESEADGTLTPFVMVSCDLLALPDSLRDAVRAHLHERLPELPATAILMHATHTHAAPFVLHAPRYQPDRTPVEHPYEIDLEVMSPIAYEAFAATRIADAIVVAWGRRAPGGIAFGLAQAVVGHNRLATDRNGKSRLYGRTDDPEFSHIEGYEDHGLQVILTYEAGSRLTGMILNIACPSQLSEHSYQLSADFWHDTREELRRRFGPDLFVLPQTATAGDQSPHLLLRAAAEGRMRQLAGRTERQEIAMRIADGVSTIKPFIEKEINWSPLLVHRVEWVPLPRRRVSEADAAEARVKAETLRAEFEHMRRDLEAHPEKRQTPRWYRDLTLKQGSARRQERVVARFALQETDPIVPIEVHVARLGDVAFASNPFEFYLDYGLQIQGRSRAVQTFLVQLAGPGTYLPTPRAVAGGAYGAVPASTEVGPESGRQLVDWTVDAINALWSSTPTAN